MTWGSVGPPWWDDRDVYVVGGGPSLRGRDLSSLPERGRVLGVNRAAELVRVDATFTIDIEFAKRYVGKLAGWARTHEVFVAAPPDRFDRGDPPVPGVTYLRRTSATPLSFDPTEIANGLNSGYGAMNLAVLKRARRVYLLGFDLVEPAPGRAHHWHDGYPWYTGSTVKYWDRWAGRFEALARALPPGVEVVNANPDSAIRSFPIVPYEELGL